jgi:hypothetical protein
VRGVVILELSQSERKSVSRKLRCMHTECPVIAGVRLAKCGHEKLV